MKNLMLKNQRLGFIERHLLSHYEFCIDLRRQVHGVT